MPSKRAVRTKERAPASPPAAEVGYTPAELAAAISPRLAAARKGAELTQQALAAQLQVVPAYVSMAERGQRLPSVEVIVAWACACRVDSFEFFSGLEAELEHRSPR